MSAYASWPPNDSWICARAATDSEPDASQPAPERACSALGAKMPRPTASTAHAMTTPRTCDAVQAPSLPIGPTAGIRRPPLFATHGTRERTRDAGQRTNGDV